MKKNWKHRLQPFFGSARLHRMEWENGLRVFLLQNRLAPVFSFQTWFDVGSRDEVSGKSGLAHLFEHMMFKGTSRRPQGVFDRTMESAGARDLNAFTSTDYTAYVASLPVAELGLVAELESDRMVNLALTREQFESEREVVQNERKQVMENNPEGRMYEELQRLAYTMHPYGRPVIGFEADIAGLRLSDCEEFYRAHYAPNRAVICISGALDHERVGRIISRHYAKLAPARARSAPPPDESPQNGERRKVLQLPLQVEKAQLAYKIPRGLHDDQLALSILCMVLSSGRSSRLYQAMVDQGLCIDVAASAATSKDPGLLYLSFTCQKGRSAEEACAILDRELDRLGEGVSPVEIERVKNKLLTEIHMGLSTNSAICRFVGQHELVLGDFQEALREIERIGRISAPDLVAAARKYFRPEGRSVVFGRPA